jgi:hypothetical protein
MEEGFDSGISTRGAIGIGVGVLTIAFIALGATLLNWRPQVNIEQQRLLQPAPQPQPTAGGKRRTRRSHPRHRTRRV